MADDNVMPRILKSKISTEWSPNLAYAVGPITSDGCLVKNSSRANFGSKEIEMMENLKMALGIKNKIGKHARGGEVEKKYFYINFKSRSFYDFLLSIGLTPAKSKSIKMVAVPNEFFGDFTRGLFDGDGSFYTFWDMRWPDSFGYKITFAAASKDFLEWLKQRLSELYGINGHIRKGVGVYEIRYTKEDSRWLFMQMHYSENNLHLDRKFKKVLEAIQFDEMNKKEYNEAVVL